MKTMKNPARKHSVVLLTEPPEDVDVHFTLSYKGDDYVYTLKQGEVVGALAVITQSEWCLVAPLCLPDASGVQRVSAWEDAQEIIEAKREFPMLR